MDPEHFELTERIIGCALRVHRVLGPGFLESVYQKSLAHELGKARLKVSCEQRLEVFYDGTLVGEFIPDMVVDGSVIVENKAIRTLVTAHEVQLVNYLKATGLDIGLLLNFGGAGLQVKRKTRLYQKIRG